MLTFCKCTGSTSRTARSSGCKLRGMLSHTLVLPTAHLSLPLLVHLLVSALVVVQNMKGAPRDDHTYSPSNSHDEYSSSHHADDNGPGRQYAGGYAPDSSYGNGPHHYPGSDLIPKYVKVVHTPNSGCPPSPPPPPPPPPRTAIGECHSVNKNSQQRNSMQISGDVRTRIENPSCCASCNVSLCTAGATGYLSEGVCCCFL